MRLATLLAVRHDSVAGFWLSHMIVFVATILGVYLAASAGLRAAIEFETLQSDRHSYHLQTALLAELQDNAAQAGSWADEFMDGNAHKFVYNKGPAFTLDTFVWSALKDSEVAFEVPPAALTPLRNFYADAAVQLQTMQTPGPKARSAAEGLKAGAAAAQVDTVPALKAHVERLKARLDRYGML